MRSFDGLSVPNAMRNFAQVLKSTSQSTRQSTGNSLGHSPGKMDHLRGMILWERDNDGPVDYVAPNHHTLSLYQGGGTGTWSVEKKRYGFADAICLLPQGYDTRWTHRGHVRNLHLYFTDADIEALNWAPAGAPNPMIFARNRTMTDLARLLCTSLDWQDATDALTADHLVLGLFSQISRGEAPRATGLTDRQLKRIEARLNHVETPPRLADLARELDMSPRHLTRSFKARTGQTLTERHRALQIQRAKDLLRTNLPLSEIALRCGFASQSHFSTAFRRATGQTPRGFAQHDHQT